MGFLGIDNDDLIRGRTNIADFLGIHPRTLDNWRGRAKKNGDPMPIFCPGGCELEANKNELKEWRQRQRS